LPRGAGSPGAADPSGAANPGEADPSGASGRSASTSKDFKDRISPAAVEGLASDLKAAWPGFPAEGFTTRANTGLGSLELKARVVHVADALAEALPDDFEAAVAVVRGALDRPGFDGWIVFPVNDWVARFGIDSPEVALPLLGELTSRWTAEYAVRPFIERHPEVAFAQLHQWTSSDDEHRRRLASEGSRPRLPWASQLRSLIEDPSPAIALLDRLVDDRSAYVRKSVANHVNDISKDHPDIAIDTVSGWAAADPTSESRRWIASHGLRSLIKAGDPDALRLLGYDPDADLQLDAFRLGPETIRLGETVLIEFELTAADRSPVMVDYRIHHAGANGTRSPKVFKLKRTVLEPGEPTPFRREHAIREVSVRRIHPGPHLIEVQVNGKVLAGATVEVLP
jgi:3-methyladenine DNA glycosylase AlkC